MTNVKLLEAARVQLAALRTILAPDIGRQIVSLVLAIDDSAATDWIGEHGDPIQHPLAGLALAQRRGLDERAILLAAMQEQRPDGRLDPLYLALSVMREIIERLLSLAPRMPDKVH